MARHARGRGKANAFDAKYVLSQVLLMSACVDYVLKHPERWLILAVPRPPPYPEQGALSASNLRLAAPGYAPDTPIPRAGHPEGLYPK